MQREKEREGECCCSHCCGGCSAVWCQQVQAKRRVVPALGRPAASLQSALSVLRAMLMCGCLVAVLLQSYGSATCARRSRRFSLFVCPLAQALADEMTALPITTCRAARAAQARGGAGGRRGGGRAGGGCGSRRKGCF